MTPLLSSIRDYLQLASYTVATIGLPIGLRRYFTAKRQERMAREKEAFAVSNQRYTAYLDLCLRYPELDAFELPVADPAVQASGLDHRTLIMFSALTAMLETAFRYYGDRPTEVLHAQWGAWDRYLRLWARRPDYRRAWKVIRPQFHDEFAGYMDRLIAET